MKEDRTMPPAKEWAYWKRFSLDQLGDVVVMRGGHLDGYLLRVMPHVTEFVAQHVEQLDEIRYQNTQVSYIPTDETEHVEGFGTIPVWRVKA